MANAASATPGSPDPCPPTAKTTMSAFNEERVLSVHHWTDKLFTFTTTRDAALRFSNGDRKSVV